VAKAGRKRALSDTSKAELLDAIASGLTRRRAAIKVGVSNTTLIREMKADSAFRTNIKRAEVEFEQKHITRIGEGEPQWQSSAWLLERKFPHWAKRERKPEPVTGNNLFVTAPAMASVAIPPGAVPAIPRSDAVQDRESRPAFGQDGEREAETGDEPVGSLPDEPAAA
jgi:hypothetical protein